MATVATTSFNSGELSPKIDCRTDTDKYASGCRVMENFIPEKYGTADRRPGSRFIVDITEDA